MVIYLHEHSPLPATNLKSCNYDDEIMNSNWNPAVVDLVYGGARHTGSPGLPDDLSTADVDEFLDRVYALATQI